LDFAENSWDEIEEMVQLCFDNPDLYDPELKDCLCLNSKENKIYQQNPDKGCTGDFTEIADVLQFWNKVKGDTAKEPVLTKPEVVKPSVLTEPEVIKTPTLIKPEVVKAPVLPEPAMVEASVLVVKAPFLPEPVVVEAMVLPEPAMSNASV
jgi:hypothetical protein